MNARKLVPLKLWVAPNPVPEMIVKPIEERLRDLHAGLRQVHAGLYINTKPGTPRFLSKEVRGDAGTKFTAYQVVFNSSVAEAHVLEVALGYGFTLVQDPEPTANMTVATVTVTVREPVAA